MKAGGVGGWQGAAWKDVGCGGGRVLHVRGFKKQNTKKYDQKVLEIYRSRQLQPLAHPSFLCARGKSTQEKLLLQFVNDHNKIAPCGIIKVF